MPRQNLVMIGAGMAGLRVLENMVVSCPDQYNITVIGDEPNPAYNRVLLSAVLAGEVDREGVILKAREWYEENNIKLITGSRVTGFDQENKTVTLEDGSSLEWDKLVLANGSNPIRLPLPGSDLNGVLTFRSFKDVDAMELAAKDKQTAVVIGGGLLGLETAYGLNKLGMKVTLLHLMDRLMERQLDDYAAAMLKDKIEAQGIEVKLNADTECILGENTVEAVKLKSGETLDADLCVMAVGISPNIALAKEAGLNCERGVVVTDQMQTSNLDIYAVGECAQHRNIAYGLVEPLYEQAAVLAKTLASDSAEYLGSSISTNLKVSGVEVFSAGEYENRDGLEQLLFRDRQNGVYKKLLIETTKAGDQILAGVVIVGDRSDGPWYNELIRARTPVQHMRNTLMFGQDISELAA